jgi:hypothetical protein
MTEREYGNDFLLLAGSYHKPRILYLELTISIVRVLMDHFNFQFFLGFAHVHRAQLEAHIGEYASEIIHLTAGRASEVPVCN